MNASRESLARALADCSVLVCVGTGGVGKTTIAAALGVAAARRGRRTLALTIDPARRLANAFGRSALGAEPIRVDLDPVAGRDAGGEAPHLEVMMLEARHAFDQLVHRLTSDPALRRRILDNRIYLQLAESLAGSLEYAAMAEVQALAATGRYDLIVVDTPPAEHALDFLRAPGRLRAFLESRFFQALVRPAMSASRFSMRLFARPLHAAIGLLERIAGIGFLDDLTELLRALDGLTGDLDARARNVQTLLFGDRTRFVLVCRPQAGALGGALDLISGVRALGGRLAAVVVNRLRGWPLAESPESLLGRLRDGRSAGDEDSALREQDPRADAFARDLECVSRSLALAAAARLAESRHFEALARAAGERDLDCIGVGECDEPLDRISALTRVADQLLGPS